MGVVGFEIAESNRTVDLARDQLVVAEACTAGHDRFDQLQELKQQDLKTARGWAIKENFRWFWEYTYAGNTKKFFDRQYG